MPNTPLDLYKTHFKDNDFERLDLFLQLRQKYGIRRALYPGSLVHVTPSFVFPVTTYVDTDKRAKRFFSHPGLVDFIAARKRYNQKAEFTFHECDYREPLRENFGSYDLLISQYAGFVSKHCKKYLKIGGILLANNSHGDASMASIDKDYALLAVVIKNGEKHRLRERGLDAYFVPKKPIDITEAYLERTKKRIGYKRTASAYLFQRVG